MEFELTCGRLGVSPFDINGDLEYDVEDVVQTVGDDQRMVSGIQLNTVIGIFQNLWLWLDSPTSGQAYKGFTGSTVNGRPSDNPVTPDVTPAILCASIVAKIVGLK
ncbi:MAG: hypothetical protein MZV65_36670 [Chromatiales bacterium]|nr:hypothetical protein [Chromatiales bacterium]